MNINGAIWNCLAIVKVALRPLMSIAKLVSILITSTFLLWNTNVLARDVSVKGYYRKDGTYVRPHMRSAPDSSVYNNWSTKGNYNPYTGAAGTVNPSGGTRYSSPTRIRFGKSSGSSSKTTNVRMPKQSSNYFYSNTYGVGRSALYAESSDCSLLTSEVKALSHGREIFVAGTGCLMHIKPHK